MNILITGGAGFIGTNFVNLISKKYPDYKITVIDKLNQQGREENLDSVKSKIDFQNFDLIQFEKLSKLFKEKEFDFVVHFAAETNVDRSIENPLEFVNSNVVATQNLLSLSHKHNIKHFHHVSTDEVFGELPLDPSIKFNEDTPYDPRSPYSATKAGSDHLALVHGEVDAVQDVRLAVPGVQAADLERRRRDQEANGLAAGRAADLDAPARHLRLLLDHRASETFAARKMNREFRHLEAAGGLGKQRKLVSLHRPALALGFQRSHHRATDLDEHAAGELRQLKARRAGKRAARAQLDVERHPLLRSN